MLIEWQVHRGMLRCLEEKKGKKRSLKGISQDVNTIQRPIMETSITKDTRDLAIDPPIAPLIKS